MKDIFSDLLFLKFGEEKNVYKASATEYLKKTGIRTDEDVLTWHVSRPIQEEIEKYINM